mmetsp:Transcript_18683/g.43414  ORF Transcript_18683/g.43414 Transcript_18683/m.43414 type:complete len:385 (-) Transcript_18683:101-1255(-)
MGSSGAKLPPIEDRDIRMLLSYNLDEKHIRKMWWKFVEMDVEKNGFWTNHEVYQLLGESQLSMRAPIIDWLFFAADSGGMGSMSFQDYLVSFCSFCALGFEEIIQLFFILVDKDRDGFISKEELVEYFSYVPPGVREPTPYFPVNNKNALDLFWGGKWKTLEFEGLAQLCERFPYILFPAFDIQERFRRKLLGKVFWEKLEDDRRRARLGHGRKRVARMPGKSHEVVRVERPGRCTMKEILEYSRRRTAMHNGRRIAIGEEDATAVMRERDEHIARLPLMCLIRNARCQYHVPAPAAGQVIARKVSMRPELELQPNVMRENYSGIDTDGGTSVRGGTTARGSSAGDDESSEGEWTTDSEESATPSQQGGGAAMLPGMGMGLPPR